MLNKQVGGAHYKDMKIQPVEFIVANGLSYLEGNAIKYICRHSTKNGEEDIDKAIHYLEMIKKNDYGRGPDQAINSAAESHRQGFAEPQAVQTSSD